MALAWGVQSLSPSAPQENFRDLRRRVSGSYLPRPLTLMQFGSFPGIHFGLSLLFCHIHATVHLGSFSQWWVQGDCVFSNSETVLWLTVPKRWQPIKVSFKQPTHFNSSPFSQEATSSATDSVCHGILCFLLLKGQCSSGFPNWLLTLHPWLPSSSYHQQCSA